MTDAHNAARAAVDGGGAGPLPPVSWSSELGGVAQAYADELALRCDLRHSSTSYGENLAYVGGMEATAAQIVANWTDERACYTYGAFGTADHCDTTVTECSGCCGHYTQVVWRHSTRIGCGMAVCLGGAHEEIWVCSYDPAGNYAGELPY